MEQKREYAFDFLRIISMYFVVVIHVSNVYSRSFGIISNTSFFISLCFNTIARISVPIFLMISGALLLERDFNKKKYFTRLGKYLFFIVLWDIIYLIWEYFFLGITYNNLFRLFLEPYRAHLWFLYTIIIIYAIQPLLKILHDKTPKLLKVICWILWILFCCISYQYYKIAEIFTIFTYIGFFILGKILYDFVKNNDCKKYSFFFIICFLFGISVCVYLNYTYSIQKNLFYNLFFAYRFPFMILAACAFYMFVLSIYKKETMGKFMLMLSDVSLGVYFIHGVFLDITVKLFSYVNIPSIIGIPIFSFIVFVCSVITTYLLLKVKYLKYIVKA